MPLRRKFGKYVYILAHTFPNKRDAVSYVKEVHKEGGLARAEKTYSTISGTTNIQHYNVWIKFKS